jgi:hypothetical protein
VYFITSNKGMQMTTFTPDFTNDEAWFALGEAVSATRIAMHDPGNEGRVATTSTGAITLGGNGNKKTPLFVPGKSVNGNYELHKIELPVLAGFLAQIKMNAILRPDARQIPEYHSHPGHAFGIVSSGWYVHAYVWMNPSTGKMEVSTRTFCAGDINWMPYGVIYHTIIEVSANGCFTEFLMLREDPSQTDWGYMDEAGVASKIPPTTDWLDTLKNRWPKYPPHGFDDIVRRLESTPSQILKYFPVQ